MLIAASVEHKTDKYNVETGYEEELKPGKSKEDETSEDVDSTSENNGIFVLNNCYKSNEQSNVS